MSSNAMSSSSSPSAAPVPRRELAGLQVPDTPLVAGAIAYAQARSEPYLFNHVMRSWLFATYLAQHKGEPYDEEVLAVSALLHDIGLTEALAGPFRFEVEGANAAREYVRGHGVDERRAQLIWDSIALNSTPSICLHKEAEAALCVLGVGLDWGGWGYERVPPEVIARIVEAYP